MDKIEYTKTATFVNRCCHDGYKFLKEYMVKNPDTKMTTVTMFNAKEISVKNGFHVNDLHKHVFIIEGDGTVLKGDI